MSSSFTERLSTPLVDSDSEAGTELNLQAELDNDVEDHSEQRTEQDEDESDDTTNGLEQSDDGNEEFDNDFAMRLLSKKTEEKRV